MTVRRAIDELQEFANRSTIDFTRALNALAAAVVSRDPGKHEVALARLSALVGDALAFADLLGRRRLLLEFDDAVTRTAKHRTMGGARRPRARPAVLAAVKGISFREAIADLVSREPRLVRVASDVQKLYRTQHAFAIARSASLKVTERVQAAMSSLLAQGVTVPEASEVIAVIGNWSVAYGETVWRTNLNSAVTAGRFRQVADPDVAKVIPAFRFSAVGDQNTRPNHQAADGLIAAVDDAVWDRLAPPLGFNCRCALQLVSKFELERRGLIANGRVLQLRPVRFREAHRDAGFLGSRPDRRFY